MNSVGQDFKEKLPRLVANIVLALAFGATGALSSAVFTGVAEGVGFYPWLIFTLVGGAFLVRVLFDVVTVGDRTVQLLLKRLGIQQQLSKRRLAKDVMCIIVTMLVTAAIFPFFTTVGAIGIVIQSATAVVAIGVVFLFVYDIARAFHQIFQEKARAVGDWLVHDPVEGMKYMFDGNLLDEMLPQKADIFGGESD